ncbi:MAG: glycosyltransferase family 4 protein [Blastocatellia bacterium]
MKILQVCSAESLGGGERHVIDLVRALIERGHEVHLAVRPGSPLRGELQDAPVIWHEMNLRNALDVISAQRIAQIIDRHGIDVLHAHVARDYIFCGIAARKARRARFYITRHHFNPIKSGAIYAWTISEVRNLIAVSDVVRDRLIEAFPAFADRVVVIPNWIDARECGSLGRAEAREALGLTRRYAVGIVGQITKLKRQDLFLQAAQHLIRERLWSEVDFLVVGEPDPKSPADLEYATYLFNWARNAGLDSQVQFTGFVPYFRVLLSAFDVIVVPSDDEAFSLVLIEAMAAGCAVIATRVGGMTEIVENEMTGLLVEPDNLWSLISSLSRLLTDTSLRGKLSNVAQASVVDRFDRERVIDRIERLYAGDEEQLPVVVRKRLQ